MPTLRYPPCREDTAVTEAEVVEVPVLLPAGDLAALEEAAGRRGLTPAQVIRRLIREFLGPGPGGPPGRADEPLLVGRPVGPQRLEQTGGPARAPAHFLCLDQ